MFNARVAAASIDWPGSLRRTAVLADGAMTLRLSRSAPFLAATAIRPIAAGVTAATSGGESGRRVAPCAANELPEAEQPALLTQP